MPVAELYNMQQNQKPCLPGPSSYTSCCVYSPAAAGHITQQTKQHAGISSIYLYNQAT
jgi:hypothetical protein